MSIDRRHQHALGVSPVPKGVRQAAASAVIAYYPGYPPNRYSVSASLLGTSKTNDKYSEKNHSLNRNLWFTFGNLFFSHRKTHNNRSHYFLYTTHKSWVMLSSEVNTSAPSAVTSTTSSRPNFSLASQKG